jgi:nitrogenase molybdenum-iron protein alpha/beta subunit
MEPRPEAPAARVAGELAQPGCAMTGFLFLLAGTFPGVAVVIFGERDCANAMPRLDSPLSASSRFNVFTVALRESDTVVGTSADRLRECLRAVARHRRPRAIIVLSTCLSEMIGADPEPACREVEAESGVPVIPLKTGGLRPRTQAGIQDWVTRTLATRLRSNRPPVPGGVNLVGYRTEPPPDPRLRRHVFRAEARRTLRAMGLERVSVVPLGATPSDWADLHRASLTVVSDRSVFADLVPLLESPTHPVLEVPPPMGVEGTDRFWRAVAAATGRDAGPVLAASPERAAAVAARDAARARWSGRRLAYGIGSHHNFHPDQLAQEGLGDLPLLAELGFDIELVIQERDRPEAHERIRRTLAAVGVDLPYHLFYEPAVLAPVLQAGRFDLAYVPDFLADQAARAGVPLVPFGSLQAGWWGAAWSCGVLSRGGASPFEARYGRWLKAGQGAGGGGA